MRLVAGAVLLLAIVLSGWTTQNGNAELPSLDPETAASIAASSGVGIPGNVDTLEPADAAGRTPEEAVMAPVDATNGGQWETLYSLYATPVPDLDNATRDWVEERETYEDFQILETRVSASDSAYVRVAYKITTTPMGSSWYSGEVEEPGEWWPVHKLDGLCKIQWMSWP